MGEGRGGRGGSEGEGEEAGGISLAGEKHSLEDGEQQRGRGTAAKRQQASQPRSSGSRSEASEDRVSRASWSDRAECEEDLAIWSLAELRLGSFIGEGGTGSVFSGAFGPASTPAAIKLFARGVEGETDLMHELFVYARLAPVQGDAVPRVLAHGLVNHCFRPFLALSPGGPSMQQGKS